MPLSADYQELIVAGERDIDVIARHVQQQFPEAEFDQPKVAHPADDDGLWFFALPLHPDDDIQIESSTGMCPFLIETNRDDRRRIGATIDETVAALVEHLATVGVA